MAEATTKDLAERVRRALRDTTTPLWIPGLTADLADAAWRELNRNIQLTSTSYGTARVLRQDPTAIRTVPVSLEIATPDRAKPHSIPIEVLPDDLAARYVGPNVRFFDADEIGQSEVLFSMRESLEILGSVPTVLPTVCSLVRALHLIDTTVNEVDVSLSEPCLPFSAFVSVPGCGALDGALRLSEAILHEAMHLQLTLVEAIVPLVSTTERTYFSPWRNEYRTAQGVLHALYVFRVIDSFLGSVSLNKETLAASHRYARKRRAAIDREVHEIRDFGSCVDLTEDGRALADRLL